MMAWRAIAARFMSAVGLILLLAHAGARRRAKKQQRDCANARPERKSSMVSLPTARIFCHRR
jgi:hypothetical protein